MPTPRRILTPIIIAAVLLAGCGNDDGDGDDATPTDPTPTEDTSEPQPTTGDTSEEPESTSTTTSAPVDPTTTVGGTRQGCQDLGGGVYQVADAGEVEIRHEGDTVELVEARPADGWTATGDTEDDHDEVEVTFSSDGREIDFEAEVDDGRLEIGDCDD